MSAAVTAFAPGRVNLIGEHTDYNGGLALPFAIQRGITVAANPLARDEVEVHALELGEHDRFPLGAPPRAAGWRAFARGVASELQADGLPVRSAQLTISSNLPQGSGLSSSAALAVALALALLAEPRVLDRMRLARVCSRVENEWLGAQTGLLDQTASLCGRDGHVLRIDFSSIRVEEVPLRLGRWTLVTVDSGESHANSASGYNRRRHECGLACEQLGVDALSDADAERAAALSEPLRRRAKHVLEENQRVEQAVAALRNDDLEQLARLLDRSHASLRDLYDASTPAVERTRANLLAHGAAGARMVGGGFGGHLLALLPPGVAAPPSATIVRPAGGARLIGD